MTDQNDQPIEKDYEAKEINADEIQTRRREEQSNFYCYGQETGTVKCSGQCDKCLDIETHLQK